ncbi:hypothetical protein K461DRAFT_128879 [Myriangium duriaei CBS 260.36]|uniref:Uncharacterized protein n=1 Tax=Myriangium duriaei CBS 260.36 TaxID=1168546 RepID=A0A9P4J2S1_9PEZI|nr:hypothetical protein K461DRAFT_128879 [Myriangium duriaei CBS 260.36]
MEEKIVLAAGAAKRGVPKLRAAFGHRSTDESSPYTRNGLARGLTATRSRKLELGRGRASLSPFPTLRTETCYGFLLQMSNVDISTGRGRVIVVTVFFVHGFSAGYFTASVLRDQGGTDHSS